MALTKNNPAARGTDSAEQKTHGGKPVKPALYIGTWVGHGRYMAAQDESGTLVRDENGRPIPYAAI